MENFFTRYRNASILVLVLFAQVLGLAVQVKRTTESGSTRLIRFWVVSAITPLEKALVDTSLGVRNVWRNYLYLRGVRHENRDLKAQVERLRIEQVRLSEDAAQARRLQALFGFKEQFISQTVAAQVIGASGSDQSHVVYIDKGASDGIKPDMAVITPDGIVGKVLRVFHASSQVLLINDSSSGVGAILESSRLQGILQGTAVGEIMMRYVMSDEKVAPGERVLTSGGDRIFPKGLPVGTVQQTNPGSDLFLNIRVKPAANLSRLEEVLVVTKIIENTPQTPEPSGPVRAADILAERLPRVPQKPAVSATGVAASQTTTTKPPAGTTVTTPTPKPSPPATTPSTALGQSAKPATGQLQTGGTSTTTKQTVGAPKPSTAQNAGVTTDATGTKPAVKPSGTTPPAGASGATTTDAAATKPAVVKPAASKPAASSEAAKPKPINSVGQPPKPAAPPPQTPPGEEVSR
ncbi:MAG TPA: rod shape-determining protein MreC [Terriglobales bacterium]|nr:rod shape-determining protein MreC [Terriglobales bacterium]